MINCTESQSCGMKQVHVWRYDLSNYHENWDKLHQIYKLWDETCRFVWRYYPSKDQKGLRQIAMYQLVVGWISYVCLKVLSQAEWGELRQTAMNQLWYEALTCDWEVLSQQWSGGQRKIAMNQYNVEWSSYTYLKVQSQQQLGRTETNCNESESYGIQQICMFDGTILAITGRGWGKWQQRSLNKGSHDSKWGHPCLLDASQCSSNTACGPCFPFHRYLWSTLVYLLLL
jgi:hypothetical protein